MIQPTVRRAMISFETVTMLLFCVAFSACALLACSVRVSSLSPFALLFTMVT